MKKLFLGAAVVASSFAFAQQFGAKAGANFSSISDEGYTEANSKVGYYAGVFMKAPISSEFSIQPEVLYNNLGAETTYGTYGSSKLDLNYISVPVMFQYNATPNFYLEAGPEASFLVGAKQTVNTTVGSGTQDLDTDDFNKFNLGLGLGAGFDITPNIGLNARYVAGFSDVTAPGSDPSTDANNKINAFSVGASFKF